MPLPDDTDIVRAVTNLLTGTTDIQTIKIDADSITLSFDQTLNGTTANNYVKIHLEADKKGRVISVSNGVYLRAALP